MKNSDDIRDNNKTQVPQICLFNFVQSEIDILKSNCFNITVGSFGNQIRIPNESEYDKNICLSNHAIPPNLHEFDILCFDMINNEIIKYDSKFKIKEHEKNIEGFYFLTEFPQNIFDPRPCIYSFYEDDISKFLLKKSIIIIFASTKELLSYQFVRMKASGYYKDGNKKQYSNYDFLISFPEVTNKTGKKMKLETRNPEWKSILNNHLDGSTYKVTFIHPTHWDDEEKKNVKNSNFYPMILNHANEIVSYIETIDDSILIVLPDMNKKGELLTELFTIVLPSLKPKLFPYSSSFNWKEEESYWLPNYGKLLIKKQSITNIYKKKLIQVDKEIDDNANEYKFLHDIISETGNKLVDVVQYYLRWLGFENVIKVDDKKDKIKEEDLRVELDDGILVIEVKGIGGTSKDNECNQIDKIVHRRERERNKFDVKGLYIVNHQRYLPPLERINPPFNKQQIEDAVHDKRGLISTWELFKLYLNISNGIITKEDAIKSLTNHGLIQFKPLNIKYVNNVKKVFKKGKIIIIHTSLNIKNGDSLIVLKNNEYSKTKILNLQLNGKNIIEAKDCKLGIEVEIPISVGSDIYLVD